ncbi:MAG: hypothetical protein MHM6MM_003483 [Cercozoa sp. M6MM]
MVQGVLPPKYIAKSRLTDQEMRERGTRMHKLRKESQAQSQSLSRPRSRSPAHQHHRSSLRQSGQISSPPMLPQQAPKSLDSIKSTEDISLTPQNAFDAIFGLSRAPSDSRSDDVTLHGSPEPQKSRNRFPDHSIPDQNFPDHSFSKQRARELSERSSASERSFREPSQRSFREQSLHEQRPRNETVPRNSSSRKQSFPEQSVREQSNFPRRCDTQNSSFAQPKPADQFEQYRRCVFFVRPESLNLKPRDVTVDTRAVASVIQRHVLHHHCDACQNDTTPIILHLLASITLNAVFVVLHPRYAEETSVLQRVPESEWPVELRPHVAFAPVERLLAFRVPSLSPHARAKVYDDLAAFCKSMGGFLGLRSSGELCEVVFESQAFAKMSLETWNAFKQRKRVSLCVRRLLMPIGSLDLCDPSRGILETSWSHFVLSRGS